MLFSKNLARSGALAVRARAAQIEVPLSVKDMLPVIELERARADRTGGQFSIVAFPREGEELPPAVVRQLIETIVKRVRIVDRVGWLSERQVGLVLPDTVALGARRLVSDLAKSENHAFSLPRCEIFTYPEKQPDATNGTLRPANGHGAAAIDPEAFPGMLQHHRDRQGKSFKIVIPKDLRRSSRLSVSKRALDIFGSAVGLILLSPVLLLISILIKLTSSGPVLFKQQRLGRHGNVFTFWKFRTMIPDADETPHRKHLERLINSDQPMVKLDEQTDSRTFPLGRFLRRACLDELPQFFNVLRGDMSLVGPRPCLPYEAEQYKLWQTRRFDALPGMTGLWQVSGKNGTTFKDMIRLDINYALDQSFWLDVKIILKTIPVMFNQIAISLADLIKPEFKNGQAS